jgi:hypothetical protein
MNILPRRHWTTAGDCLALSSPGQAVHQTARPKGLSIDFSRKTSYLLRINIGQPVGMSFSIMYKLEYYGQNFNMVGINKQLVCSDLYQKMRQPVGNLTWYNKYSIILQATPTHIKEVSL